MSSKGKCYVESRSNLVMNRKTKCNGKNGSNLVMNSKENVMFKIDQIW